MPSCRRDQTKFAAFLAILVTVEVISIVTFMHLEHRKAARRSGNYEQELQLAVPHTRRNGANRTAMRAVAEKGEGNKQRSLETAVAHEGGDEKPKGLTKGKEKVINREVWREQ